MKEKEFNAIVKISVGRKYIRMSIEKKRIKFTPENSERGSSILKYLKDAGEER